MQSVSMLGSWFDKIVDFIVGFFAFIPQLIYFLYASIASFLDLLQYLVRKLAGLDVYYVDGQAQSGDLIVSFIKGIVGIDKSPTYSAVSTVFWSLVIFGVILLFVTTIVAIIKAHYNYDSNKSSPMRILFAAIKSLATMAIVPIVAIFGVLLANIILGTLDTVTSASSASVLYGIFEPDAVKKFKAGEDTRGNLCYTSFDYFSAGAYTNTSTFSGMLFEVAGNSCNRVRSGDYGIVTQQNDNSKWDNMGVFYVSTDNSDQRESLAKQVDYAFANNLTLASPWSAVKLEGTSDAGDLWSSLRFGYSLTISAGLFNVKSFSKYNVGLVWYFYDLWAFNWILGFAGIIISATMFGNIIFGLMTRLLQVIALFIVFPALIGIMPLDEGNAFSSWRKQFVSNILMAFGAVVGMNIFFLILPFFQTISFFNNYFLDGIMNMIIVIAGLTLIKKFINMVSGFVGGEDANKTGEQTRQDVTASAVKGVMGTLGASALGVASVAPIVGGMKAGGKAGKALGKKIAGSKLGQKFAAAAQAGKDKRTDNKVNKMFGREKGSAVSPEERAAFANLKKLDRKERKAILKLADKRADMVKSGSEEDKAKARSKTLVLHGGAGTTRQSKEAFKQHQANMGSRKQVKADKRYKRAQKVAEFFGQDPSKINKAEVGEDGKYAKLGSSTFKGFGMAVVDFTKSFGKAFADLSGASGAWKKLGDAGAVDKAKDQLKGVFSAFGVSTKDSKGHTYKPLRTKQDKEDEDKANAKAAREEQLKELTKLSANQESTTKAIHDLITELKKSGKI